MLTTASLSLLSAQSFISMRKQSGASSDNALKEVLARPACHASYGNRFRARRQRQEDSSLPAEAAAAKVEASWWM
jgi:hypothetical protein